MNYVDDRSPQIFTHASYHVCEDILHDVKASACVLKESRVRIRTGRLNGDIKSPEIHQWLLNCCGRLW